MPSRAAVRSEWALRDLAQAGSSLRGLASGTIGDFPVPVDLLVSTQDERRPREEEGAPFLQRLDAEVRWVA